MKVRTKKNGPGFVYLMMNEAAPGRTKIGLSIDVDRRAEQLSRATASPGDAKVLVAVEVSSMLWLEDRLHHAFRHARIATRRGKREWFEIGPDPVLKEIRRLAANPEGSARIRSIDVRYTPGAVGCCDPVPLRPVAVDADDPVVAALLALDVPLHRIHGRPDGHAVVLGDLPSSGAPCFLVTPPAYLCRATNEPQLGPVLRAIALYKDIRGGREIADTGRTGLDRLRAGRHVARSLLPLVGDPQLNGQFVLADPDLMIRPDLSYAIRAGGDAGLR